MGRRARFTGLAGVVTVWSFLLAATAISGFDVLGDEPLSYLGAGGRAAPLFTVGLAGSALLFIAFHGHVRSRYRVSTGFSLAMLAGLAGQLVAAFVPIGGDPAAHRLHTAFALLLGASLPVLMWRFAAGQPEGRWRRISFALLWSEVVACAAGLALSSLSVAAVAEVLPAAVFHAWIVALTFPGRHAPGAASPGSGTPQADSGRVESSERRWASTAGISTLSWPLGQRAWGNTS